MSASLLVVVGMLVANDRLSLLLLVATLLEPCLIDTPLSIVVISSTVGVAPPFNRTLELFPPQVATKGALTGPEKPLGPDFIGTDPGPRLAFSSLFRYVGRGSYRCGHLRTPGKVVSEVLIPTISLILLIVL